MRMFQGSLAIMLALSAGCGTRRVHAVDAIPGKGGEAHGDGAVPQPPAVDQGGLEPASKPRDLPNLVVRSATANVLPGNLVSFRAVVCNVGRGISGVAQLALYWDRPKPPHPGETYEDEATMPALLPTSCVDRVFLVGFGAGVHHSGFLVDHDQKVDELDELDNIFWPLVVVVDGSAGTP